MTIATAIRSQLRSVINQLGSTASLYSFSSATKSSNEEGDVSVSDWGSATTIKAISANNFKVRRLLERFGEESNKSDRGFLVRDDVTINVRDKVTIDSESYLVHEIKRIDPIENTLLAYKITLVKDENY